MTDRMNGGSPVVNPQQYQTVPTAVINGAHQRDRYPNQAEFKELSAFLSTGLQRLEIAQVLAQQSDGIVAAGGKRIFVGGDPMAYFEKPEDPLGLPGSGYFVAEDYLSTKDRRRKSPAMQVEQTSVNSITNPINWFKGLFFSGKPSVPSSFRAISISTYGKVRMKRSMRDLGWFLRYVTYAIVAGDTSIISVNTRGLRGVIPEDVTLATAVALREMQWKSLSYFPSESAAAALVKRYFDVLIADYWVEKPSDRLRTGVSKHHQGLYLPESYEDNSTAKPRWVMKPDLPELEKHEVIKAAYRQVFERDVTQLYGSTLAELVSQVKGGHGSAGSMAEFIRQLGHSKLYRKLYYEPYSISRSIELACRHFLGRGLSCMEEFQCYFERVAEQGFPALVDTLVDSQEYADYFGEETVPYLRELGREAQECRNWGPQLDLFKYSAPVRQVPQFVTTFASYRQPLPNQHPYGTGNDPLEIQFGAIFPQENRHPQAQPAHFSEHSRRILIHTNEKPRTHYSVEAVILAAYRQVFGCDVSASEHHIIAETQLKAGRITLREFVRQIARSKSFRRNYWEHLYITKAVEVIHRRLLGRPTYSRQETNQYYDICSRQGFYALVDALIDSDEYLKVFGEDTAPYERYVTPRGLALRSPQGPVAWSQPREHPVIVEEYMMHYQPPASKAFLQSVITTQNRHQMAAAKRPLAGSALNNQAPYSQQLSDGPARSPEPVSPEKTVVQTDPDSQPDSQMATAQLENSA
ncbi:MAG: photosystem I reaction center subunit XI [Phormidesmis sp. RL_2_1]|nr:photosystem I reaction center subunit XI [Phormidesmis sp. RL_2_1]